VVKIKDMINEILNESLLAILLVGLAYVIQKFPMSKTDAVINEIPNPYYKSK
jgi:hypothetical protein